MQKPEYLMESDDEALRLDMKTDGEAVEKQALWAGIDKGMRVADLGCGSGKTTYHLHRLVEPAGEAIGIDFSRQRIEYAETHYRQNGLSFLCRDIRDPMDDLGLFDFVWVRFLLEYYRTDSFDIIKRTSGILKPGGILCLVDLDFNCLIYHGLSPGLEAAIAKVIHIAEQEYNFDPYAGKRLYSFLYDLDYRDIEVDLQPYNLIYGKPEERVVFNWAKKMTFIEGLPESQFEEFPGGRDGLMNELRTFIHDPRRFTYTPLISCRGIRPDGDSPGAASDPSAPS